MPPKEFPPADPFLAHPAVRPAAIAAFLEGPAWHPEHGVFFSDIQNNRILKLDNSGNLDVFRGDSGRANGNVFDCQGRLITCEGAEFGPGGRRRVTRTNVDSGELEILSDRYQGARYNSPNDVVVTTSGDIYFTDPCYGDRSAMEMDFEGAYLINTAGEVRRILEQPTIQRPNGLAISPDESTLYVIDSNPNPNGNRKVWAFALQPDGSATAQRLVYDFAPGRGGDGMEVDSEGNLFVCAGINVPRSNNETDLNPPGVYIISPAGALLARIPIPEDVITNCCFAGEDLRQLYVTSGRTLYAVSLRTAGYHSYPSTSMADNQ